MVRKILLYGTLLIFLGALAYGYMTYAVVALFKPKQPKITYLILVEKPKRGTDFYYDYKDEKQFANELKFYERKNIPPPWHMNYDWVFNHAIYIQVLDNRQFDKASPLKNK